MPSSLIFFNLLSGATALIDDCWPNEDAIIHNLNSFKPTHFFSVPILFDRLMEHTENIAHIVERFEYTVSAGSTLSSDIFVKWKSRFSTEILDGIGATEVGHIFISNRPGSAIPGVTGKPLYGYEVKLITNEGIEAKVNHPGELWVKGPSVSSGYNNSPQKKKDRFVNGWYKTGDKFVKDQDSNFRFLGRVDDIFKSKGIWVHPQEIEDFLRASLNWVDEVALIPSETEESKPILCLVKNKTSSSVEKVDFEMLDYIINTFGSHCTPKEYRELSHFPRNENGKILRKKLFYLEPIHVFSVV